MENENKSIGGGLAWKLCERFGVAAVQFILQVVLARILAPELYGVLAIMIVFTTLATVFVQNGFNTALIQNKDVMEEDYSSVLWVSLAIAVVLYGIIYLCAPLIGDFYHMPDIVWPLRVLALMLIPGALNSVQLAKVSRDMDFKKVFYSNIGGIVISGVVGIIIAYLDGGLWALVIQTLLNIVVVCIVMRFTVKLKIRFVCNWSRIKILFSYGWKLLVSSLLNTLYQELRSLVIGKKYDSGTLGFYSRGKQFPQFINSIVNSSVQSVLLPAMSMKQDDSAQVKRMMRNAVSISAYVMFPVMAGLAAVATPVVTLLLTEKWLPCVPYMQLYCFSFAFYPVHSCNLQAINAIGRSDIFLKLEIIKKVYGIILLAIAVIYFDSPIAIASTGLISTWISWLVNAYPNKKLIGYSYKEQIQDVFPSFFLALVMAALVYLFRNINANTLLVLLVQVAVGLLSYLCLSLLLKPQPYVMLLNEVKRVRKKD